MLDAKTPEGRSRLSDEQVSLTARHVEVGLESESIVASGMVKSVLQPQQPGRGAKRPRASGLPADEKAVNVNAERLTSAAGGDRFVYTGEAMLWQGETAIRADSIDFDREEGNLAATGSARMALPMKEGLATGRAMRIRYTQNDRRLAFGDATKPGAPSAADQPIAARGAGPQRGSGGPTRVLERSGGGGSRGIHRVVLERARPPPNVMPAGEEHRMAPSAHRQALSTCGEGDTN